MVPKSDRKSVRVYIAMLSRRPTKWKFKLNSLKRILQILVEIGQPKVTLYLKDFFF